MPGQRRACWGQRASCRYENEGGEDWKEDTSHKAEVTLAFIRLPAHLPCTFLLHLPFSMIPLTLSTQPSPITQGALAFLVFYLLTSLGLLFKMKLTGDISTYFPTKWYAFLLAGVANHVLSFLLFWTMGYTLIHIY